MPGRDPGDEFGRRDALGIEPQPHPVTLLADRLGDLRQIPVVEIDYPPATPADQVMMGLIAIAMWPEFVKAWMHDDFFGTPGIFTAPWWPVRLAIVFSAGMCCLIFAMKSVTGRRVIEHVHLGTAER